MFIVTVVCGIFKTVDYLGGYVWRYYLKASVDEDRCNLPLLLSFRGN